MAIFYLDYVNGLDANNGSSWALAWKTMTSGATAARIAPGDIIKIAKSPAPVALSGTGQWTDNTIAAGGFPATIVVSGAIDNGSGLIRLTLASTATLTNNDVVQILSVAGTVEANGSWLCSVIDGTNIDLQGSAFVTAYTSGGTCRKINSKAVVLSAAQTKNICDCEKIWTAAGDGTPTIVAVGTDAKEGSNCTRLTMDAATLANIKQGYFAIPTTDFSGYQKISFWIKNSAAVATATTWSVRLCSDTAGVTTVDTFVIPAIPSTARWVPLTIARTGGGNLGASIQSIAIYSGTTAPTNSCNILIDNFIACTTSGLNLQSLISKNSAEQGGDEGWYGIQSINSTGTVVLLDNDTNTKANGGRGYSGTSETVTTYIRETIKTTMGTAVTSIIQEFMDSGTNGNNIQFQGGYDTSTGLQTGETFFDGLNGNGYGVQNSAKSFITLSFVNPIRYNYGIYYLSNAHNNTITITNANNNTSYGIYYLTPAHNNTITITNVNNNTSYGVVYSGASNNTAIITNVNNNASYGIYHIASANNNTAILTNVNNNTSYGIGYNACSNNTVTASISSTSAGIYNDTGINYLRDSIIVASTDATGFATLTNAKIFSLNHDNIIDNHWIFTDGGTINSLVNDRSGGSGLKWKYSITGSSRASNYPLGMPLMEIPVNADAEVTVTCYVMKDHATDIDAELVCKGGQIAGVTNDVVAVKANDTNWEQLTLTFTPTESGVVEIQGLAHYNTGLSNAYFADVTVVQN